MHDWFVRFCRPLALGNTADAVEILSAGYILGAFEQEDGSPLNSTQKGKPMVRFQGLEQGSRGGGEQFVAPPR